MTTAATTSQDEPREIHTHQFDSLSESQLDRLCDLRVLEAQEDFGGTFRGTVEEWQRETGPNVLGLAFSYDDRFVGAVLLKRPPASPDWTPNTAISLHGLKIATEYQGRGFGRAALQLSLLRAKEAWLDASALVLAVDAGNTGAIALYRSFGMSDSGPIFEGRVGLEHRLEISLVAAFNEV